MVDLKTINRIAKNFKIDSECVSFSELQSGHINDTYLISTSTNKKFVLQKINTTVFKNVIAVINNKQILSDYFKSITTSLNYQFVVFIETNSNSIVYIDPNNSYWNLMIYIPNSHTFDVAQNTEMVFEAGKLYGDFLLQTSDVLTTDFKETILDFHSMPMRLGQFDTALENTKIDIKLINELLNIVFSYREEMCIISQLKAENKMPLRVTHNDTKLSNILFDKNGKGLAVIDLDTIMPGIVHFDFGDSIRSICSTAKEDEQNLDLVEINLDFYEAYCKGYSIYTKTVLSELEITYLPLSIKTMIYIMGLRFLTDYLNGNIYYKVNHPKQNLDRAKNQFKLLKSVDSNHKQIQEITSLYFAK